MSTTEPSLNQSLGDLAQALADVPDLAGLRMGLQGYQRLLGSVDINHPEAVNALAVADVWGSLDKVASAVLALGEEETNGCS